MKSARLPLQEAEHLKQLLMNNNLIDTSYQFTKDRNFFYIAITDEKKVKKLGIKTITKILKKREREETSLKEALKTKLTKKELERLKTAFDIIGDIAILEIDRELEKKKTIIAKTLLKINKRIKTVLRKQGSHEGEFRTQKMEFLAGEDKRETIHKENNILLQLDVEKVYFSPRVSTERKRIAELVKPDEEILVMFSGCAPYPCVLARNTKARYIVGVEINPDGHYYGLENLALNHLKTVELVNGDVKDIVPVLDKKFDRILMPLPKSAEDFLDTALSASKKGTIIHFYDFLNEAEFDKAEEKIAAACKKNKKQFKILKIVRCGQHAPHVFRICVDVQIL